MRLVINHQTKEGVDRLDGFQNDVRELTSAGYWTAVGVSLVWAKQNWRFPHRISVVPQHSGSHRYDQGSINHSGFTL